MKLFGFRPRGTGNVHKEFVPPSAAEVNEMRLLELRDRIAQAERLIRDHLTAQSVLYAEDRDDATADVLLDLLVALGVAPAAKPDVPVVPGRSS